MTINRKQIHRGETHPFGDVFRYTEVTGMNIHNKLVRDKIPEVLQRKGVAFAIHRLDQAQYRLALLEKLVEEAQEAREKVGDKERLLLELSDVQEVLAAIIKEFGLDKAALDRLQRERWETRGGFEERLFLEWSD
jgi:predicted house-cleaning noncanonical NTP pyrophosphatase (MazG superfamily)